MRDTKVNWYFHRSFSNIILSVLKTLLKSTISLYETNVLCTVWVSNVYQSESFLLNVKYPANQIYHIEGKYHSFFCRKTILTDFSVERRCGGKKWHFVVSRLTLVAENILRNYELRMMWRHSLFTSVSQTHVTITAIRELSTLVCSQVLLLPPTPNIIFYHIFFIQNIKPRCVLNSIYQTNPENNGFLEVERIV